MYKGWKLLNQEEREHLKETGAFQRNRECSTRALKQEFRLQKKMQKERGGRAQDYPCSHCHRIGKKLGYIGGARV